jgi:hypothetical protein
LNIGILITALRKVILMPTPFKSQRLMVELTKISSPSASTTGQPSLAPISSSKQQRAVLERQDGRRHLLSNKKLKTTANNKSDKKPPPFYLDPIDYSATKNSSIIIKTPNSEYSLRIFVNDLYYNPLNTTMITPTSPEVDGKRTFVLGEAFLTPHFKLYQVNHFLPPSVAPTVSPTTAADAAVTVKDNGNQFISNVKRKLTAVRKTYNQEVIPPPSKTIQEPADNAYENPHCPYFIELSVNDEKLDSSVENIPDSWISSYFPDFSAKQESELSEEEQKATTGNLKDEAIPEYVSPAGELAGQIRNCQSYYSFTAVSFEKDVSAIADSIFSFRFLNNSLFSLIV